MWKYMPHRNINLFFGCQKLTAHFVVVQKHFNLHCAPTRSHDYAVESKKWKTFKSILLFDQNCVVNLWPPDAHILYVHNSFGMQVIHTSNRIETILLILYKVFSYLSRKLKLELESYRHETPKIHLFKSSLCAYQQAIFKWIIIKTDSFAADYDHWPLENTAETKTKTTTTQKSSNTFQYQ